LRGFKAPSSGNDDGRIGATHRPEGREEALGLWVFFRSAEEREDPVDGYGFRPDPGARQGQPMIETPLVRAEAPHVGPRRTSGTGSPGPRRRRIAGTERRRPRSGRRPAAASGRAWPSPGGPTDRSTFS
jgi:hypothetical protein